MVDPGETPSVLIVGGFLTGPYNYQPMRRRLLARGAPRVDIARVWPMDWVACALRGFAPLIALTRRAIVASYRAGGDRPIMVVGHSGGGLLARLAMSPVPYRGSRGGAAPAVGALITLGTPHRFSAPGRWPQHPGYPAVRFADRVIPGAYFAPTTGYMTVGARSVLLRPQPPVARWRGAGSLLMSEVATALAGPWDQGAAGDGLVSEAAAYLDGARQLTFDDVVHGQLGHWYGSDDVIDRWWPVALEIWREAVDARAVRDDRASRG